MQRPRRSTPGWKLKIAGALCVIAAVSPVYAAQTAGASGVSLAQKPRAVWRESQVDFSYPGRTVRYSCEGLRDKVRAMLLDLGARRDLEIAAVGCLGAAGVLAHETGPRLSLRFSALALADRAAPSPRAGDPASTDARFESFTITSDAFRNMGIDDCELVAEFVRQVLPKFATRDVMQNILCAPSRRGAGRFWVRGEILRAFKER